MKKYKVIYADPPWQFNNKNTGGSMISGASAVYPVMNVDDICRIPVQNICDDDCVLIMWWIASQPEEALKVMKAWGFKLKTMTVFTWVKYTVTGKDMFGMGFWTRQGSENCLIATRGNIKRASAAVRNVVHAQIQEHSRKPDEVRKRIVHLMGDVPRIELFAREQKEGWDKWGNEIENSVDIQKQIEICNS